MSRRNRSSSRSVRTLATISWVLMSGIVLAQESPYYVRNETFALSPDKQGLRNKIIAFLPRRYLLYTPDRDQSILVAGKRYVPATTQDGVDVLVLESDVSDKPFAVSIGRHEIIFNSAFDDLVCRDPACIGDEEERYWKISRGDAFKIDGPPESGLLKVKGSDNIVGYVGETRLRAQIDRGFVTRADETLPRYEITKKTLKALSTRCGSKVSQLIDVNEEEDSFQKVVDLVPSVGWKDEGTRLEISELYGGGKEKYEFRVYDIQDRRSERRDSAGFFVVAALTYDCVLKEFGSEDLKYIKRVTIWSSREGRRFDLKIDELPFETPTDLAEYTGAPYLVSINSYEHFEAVISKLSEVLGDRALAGYALSELNRSCVYRERKSGGRCRGHNYPRAD